MLLVILIILIITGAIGGGAYYRHQNGIPNNPQQYQPTALADIPAALGFKSRWIAVKTTDEEKVVSHLNLTYLKRTTWREGAHYAAQGNIFVAPPVDQWTVAFGQGFLAPDSLEHLETLKQLLRSLSAAHREAQYFCSDSSAGLHCWIKAEKGEIVRLQSWNFTAGAKALSEGEPTPTEKIHLDALASGNQGEMKHTKMGMEELVMKVAESWGG